jgi:hypothetical protein
LKTGDSNTDISYLELVKMEEAWQVTCSRSQYKGEQEVVFRVGKEKDINFTSKQFSPSLGCTICKRNNHLEEGCYFRNKCQRCGNHSLNEKE